MMPARRISSGSGSVSGSGSSRGSLEPPSARRKPHGPPYGHGHGHAHDYTPPPVSVESLVEHLLAAKRALSSVTAVLRAKELVAAARSEHEDAAILAARAGFVRAAVVDQVTLLARLRRSLQVTYDSRRRRFDKLTRTMDAAHQKLQGVIDELGGTTVRETIRPGDDGRSKTLLDFVDQNAVEDLVGSMRRSIRDLQMAQQSFDGDLLRLDNDMLSIRKALSEGLRPLSPSAHNDLPPELLASLVDHSGVMALLLSSLNQHFDHCVTAVRVTDGGMAVARRKAAEDNEEDDSVAGGSGGGGTTTSGHVSISGYIAEQESHLDDNNLEPMSAEQRDELMRVVVNDAAEVDDVVGEIRARLAVMEEHSALLHERVLHVRATHTSVLAAHGALEDVESRLGGYVAAEAEFTARWDVERAAILDFVDQMVALRDFYQSYASAYASLVLEIKRRGGVRQRIDDIWRKARESVERLVDEDQKQREAFKVEAGAYLPGDLWACIPHDVTRWEVVPVAGEASEEASGGASGGTSGREAAATALSVLGPGGPARGNRPDRSSTGGGRSSHGR